jgi:hypothetical protein
MGCGGGKGQGVPGAQDRRLINPTLCFVLQTRRRAVCRRGGGFFKSAGPVAHEGMTWNGVQQLLLAVVLLIHDVNRLPEHCWSMTSVFPGPEQGACPSAWERKFHFLRWLEQNHNVAKLNRPLLQAT